MHVRPARQGLGCDRVKTILCLIYEDASLPYEFMQGAKGVKEAGRDFVSYFSYVVATKNVFEPREEGKKASEDPFPRVGHVMVMAGGQGRIPVRVHSVISRRHRVGMLKVIIESAFKLCEKVRRQMSTRK